jgi:two-component system KDP operon response regulator KdpE
VSEPLPVVIVIEDEPTIRRFIKMSLEAEGCQVYEADAMKRGLIEVGTRHPDMVVLDLGLPDGDGVDFIRDLRTWSDIPVIVLSARSGSGASVLEFGNIRVDLGRRVVEKAGQSLHLTPIEYRLLTYLITHPDSVLTHRQLLKNVWGPSHAEDSHYVRVYMGLLRKKIEDDPSQPKHLITEAGVGYRFVA